MKKGYETIDDYVHIESSTSNKIKASLEPPNCEGDCCDSYEKLGPHSLEKESWKSNCPCRSRNMECNSDICKCTKTQCKNQAISNKSHKKLDVDVIEKYAWGIDLFTYRNLIDFLPHNFLEDYKATFIEKKLLKSLCNLGKEGYDLHHACEQIMNNSNSQETYSETDILFATTLYKLFKLMPEIKIKTSKSFSKGVGMFCNNPNGIKENEFITGYYGEIYPPWYWYEKQDLIKSEKLDKELPDFYNIMLERLKCDKRGYDVVVVDPNSKGNFASRMSHSCFSNCNTVLMAANKEYIIGMYATKNIEFGEELTFNYNSVTEKKKEYLDAICLCGSYYCRGHYLIYEESMIFTEVLSKHHNFVHRNYILFKACVQDKIKLSEEEECVLDKFSIRSSILANAPNWLKKWSALILEFIEFESKALPEIMMNQELGIKNKKNNISSLSDGLTDEVNLDSDSSKSTHSFPKYKENKRKVYNEEDKKILEKLTEEKNKKDKKNVKKVKINEINAIEKNTINSPAIDNELIKRNFELNDSSIMEINNFDKNTINNSLFEHELIRKNFEFNDSIIFDENKNSNLKNNIKTVNVNKINNFKNLDEELNKFLNQNTSSNDKMENDTFCDKKLDIISKIECESNKSTIIQNNLPVEGKIINENNAILPNSEVYKHQIRGIKDNRIQNLAITLNKVMHVLNLLKTESPPLTLLKPDEIFEFLYEGQDSIRGILLKNFKVLLEHQSYKIISPKLSENISKILNLLKTGNNSNTSLQKNLVISIENIKASFIKISKILKECEILDPSKNYLCYSGLSDMLFLYSNTSTYFTHSPKYNSVLSDELHIRKRDINTNLNDLKNGNLLSKEKLDEPVHTGTKEYDRFYIWGQLVGWFKQTVRFILIFRLINRMLVYLRKEEDR